MRKVWDFHGGIHPSEQKEQSNRSPIIHAGIPDELIFPLSQHIGAPASAMVNVGDKVLKGQMIGAAKGFVSVPVHASTSGEVVAIEPRSVAHPSAMNALCIVIKTDGADQWINRKSIDNYQHIDKSQLLALIREAGIAGMGGAGFPTAVKLSPGDERPIETLIINGTECEPYITADDRLMRERAEQIIEGSKILRYLINPSKETVIGIEDNKPEAIAALNAAAKDTEINIVSFPTKYPSGGEKQLIQILTGKEVNSQGLPADIGVVCQNVGSTVAIYNAVKHGTPLISRITTVTGNACKQPQNYEVLLGTPIHHLLDLCGFKQQQCSRLIMGGPMMGFTLENTQVPVVKTTNCLLAATATELCPPAPAQACIRCGLCAEACPVSLLPQQLYWFARGKEYEKLEAHHLMDCIECGACSYVCPSNIPLVQYYRSSKSSIRVQKQDHIKAEHSKLRFEARKERLQRQELEKEAKRNARKQAVQARTTKTSSSGDNKADLIQAAIERTNAKKVLATNNEPRNLPKQNDSDSATKTATDDIVARALTKRAAASTMTEQQKLQQAVKTLTARLEKTQQKLADAQAQGNENESILADSVDKLGKKLADAITALEEKV